MSMAMFFLSYSCNNFKINGNRAPNVEFILVFIQDRNLKTTVNSILLNCLENALCDPNRTVIIQHFSIYLN